MKFEFVLRNVPGPRAYMKDSEKSRDKLAESLAIGVAVPCEPGGQTSGDRDSD
jgi:hypothetical protein